MLVSKDVLIVGVLFKLKHLLFVAFTHHIQILFTNHFGNPQLMFEIVSFKLLICDLIAIFIDKTCDKLFLKVSLGHNMSVVPIIEI